VNLLSVHNIVSSMDRRGCWRDRVFVERLWKSIKYEEIYLPAYDSVSEVQYSLVRYLMFYNQRRSHSSLGGSAPDRIYFKALLLAAA
jgi:putative transposase